MYRLPFFTVVCFSNEKVLLLQLVLKLPSVHIPGFRSSAKDGPGPIQQSTGKDLPQGYQPSHRQLAGEFMRRAALSHAANSGEYVHVKAILAHFRHGSTTATMIGVCDIQVPEMSIYDSHAFRMYGRW